MVKSEGGNSFEDNGAGSGGLEEAGSAEAMFWEVSRGEEETSVGERGGGKVFC